MARASVRPVCQQLMELDVSELIGAAHGKRNPDGRLTQRTGYRDRASPLCQGRVRQLHLLD